MPIIASRMSNVNIQVSANRTIVFAGLLDKSGETIEKVPFIGDVPWIGQLFNETLAMNRPRIWCTKFGHLLIIRTDVSSLDDFAHVSQRARAR